MTQRRIKSLQLEALNNYLDTIKPPTGLKKERITLSEMPEYSYEDFLSDKKFREFLDSSYSYGGAEYDDIIKRFLSARLCSRLSKKEKLQGRSHKRDELLSIHL